MNDRFFSAGAAQRTRLLSEGKSGKGPAVYWMSREQRARDNWGLLAAQEAASEPGRGLVVLFCFSPSFSSASSRHYAFLEGGLRETATILEGYNIPLLFLYGDPGEKIPEACRLLDAALLVTDFDPYPEKRPWKKKAAASSGCPVFRRAQYHTGVDRLPQKRVQCGHFPEKGRSPPRRMAPGVSAA